MRGMIRVALIAGCAVLCAPILAIAGAEDEVIAITYAQWAADMEKDSAKALSILADDYTEFNFQAPTRIDGKKMAAKMAEAANQADGGMVMAEMLNPKVQVYGDTAILTYNFFGMTKLEGEVTPFLAKSTRVYVQMGGDWKLVHANFAPVGGGGDD